MQSMRSLGFSLTAVLVLLCGCGHGGGSAPSSITLSYAQSSAVFVKGVAITADIPTSSGGVCDLVQRESGASRGPDPELLDGSHQWNPNSCGQQ